MDSKKGDQFSSGNCFIFKSVASKQPTESSQSSEDFSSPVPSSRRSNFITSSPNRSEGYPLNYLDREKKLRAIRDFRRGCNI